MVRRQAGMEGKCERGVGVRCEGGQGERCKGPESGGVSRGGGGVCRSYNSIDSCAVPFQEALIKNTITISPD